MTRRELERGTKCDTSEISPSTRAQNLEETPQTHHVMEWRSDGKLSARFTTTYPSGKQSEVTLSRIPPVSGKLGLHFEVRHSTLLIKQICRGGLVASWNAGQTKCQIKKGQQITALNHKKGEG